MKTKRFFSFPKLSKKYPINNKIIFVFILGILFFPILFLLFFRLYYFLLPGEEIGSKGDWISFSGGYIGSILTLAGVWWQLHLSQKKEEEKEAKNYKTFKKYIRKIVDFNLEELEKSRDNLSKTYTYHFGFIDRKEIFNFKEIEETIFKKYFDKIVEENDNILIDLYNSQESLKKHLEIAIILFEQKREIFDKIKQLKEENKIKKEIKKEEMSEVKRVLPELRETYINHSIKFCHFNNFINSSYLVHEPERKQEFFFRDEFTVEHGKFLSAENLIKEDIGAETPIDFYWDFYNKLIDFLASLTLCIDDNKKEEIEKDIKLYYLIVKIKDNDLRRKNIIEEYEQILNESKKILDIKD